ncbi:MAG: VOC family protein [Planctomycetota bacterium]
MRVRLEHANVAVTDIVEVADFLRSAFPDFRVRHGGTKADGSRWMHVGDDDVYLSLEEAHESDARERYGPREGLNHLGFVVDDAEAVRARLAAAGYTDTTPKNTHPARRRVYFEGPGGLEIEFVQYLSADAVERNDYSDA